MVLSGKQYMRGTFEFWDFLFLKYGGIMGFWAHIWSSRIFLPLGGVLDTSSSVHTRNPKNARSFSFGKNEYKKSCKIQMQLISRAYTVVHSRLYVVTLQLIFCLTLTVPLNYFWIASIWLTEIITQDCCHEID